MAERTSVPCPDISSHERFTGIGKTVHDVAEESEKLHQEGVDGQNFRADATRRGCDESENCGQAHGAEKNVAIDFEEPFHLLPVEGIAQQSSKRVAVVGVVPDAAQLPGKKEKSDSQAAVLRNDCAQGHAANVPVQHQDEHKAAHNVDAVEKNGNPHGQTGVLHADKPPLDGIKSQRGGGCPYPYKEIGERKLDDMGAALENEQ